MGLNQSESEETPEIVFYCQDTDGHPHRIMEIPAASNKLGRPSSKDAKTKKMRNLRSEWSLQQQIVEKTSYKGPLIIGLLHFWTRTARLHVSRKPWQTHDGFAYSLIGLKRENYTTQVFIDATAHLKFKDINVKSEVPEGILVPSAANQTYEIGVLDFVVVTTICSKNELCALAVEWKDGVAYRVGIANVKETEWIELRNIEWKMVTLG
jgi:hypothetical protein